MYMGRDKGSRREQSGRDRREQFFPRQVSGTATRLERGTAALWGLT